MREIAPDVFHLPLLPRNGVNAYLVGDVLVDTGLRTSAGKIKDALGGRKLQAIALTHAHGDHGGSARKLSEALSVPVWVGAADREATETGKAVTKPPFDKPGISVIAGALGNFPAVPVARELREGDELSAGFTVLVNLAASRARLAHLRRDPRVALTVLDEGSWYRHVSLLGRVASLERDPGLVDIDRLATRYAGAPHRDRVSERWSAWIEVARWHAWIGDQPWHGERRPDVDA